MTITASAPVPAVGEAKSTGSDNEPDVVAPVAAERLFELSTPIPMAPPLISICKTAEDGKASNSRSVWVMRGVVCIEDGTDTFMSAVPCEAVEAILGTKRPILVVGATVMGSVGRAAVDACGSGGGWAEAEGPSTFIAASSPLILFFPFALARNGS